MIESVFNTPPYRGIGMANPATRRVDGSRFGTPITEAPQLFAGTLRGNVS